MSLTNSIFSLNDVNECAKVYEVILENEVDKSDENKKKLTDDFQNRITAIIEKYTDTKYRSPEREIFHLLGRKELLNLNMDGFHRILPFKNGNEVSPLLERIYATDKVIFEMLFSEMTDLTEENEKLRARIAFLESNPPSNSSASSSSLQKTPRSPVEKPQSSNNQLTSSQASNSSSPSLAHSTSSRSAPRGLSLLKLESLIEEIYSNKKRFDARCVDAHLPKESILSYLPVFLQNRFGLRSLVDEHYVGILRAAPRFAARSNSVAVFYATLRGEIDDEFTSVQRQLTETVQELLRGYLRGKNPVLSEKEVIEKRNSYVRENLPVETDMWRSIIAYMYNETDQRRLMRIIQTRVAEDQAVLDERRASLQQQAQIDRLEKYKRDVAQLAYGDFLKILLDFQLLTHIEYLRPFAALFRTHALPLAQSSLLSSLSVSLALSPSLSPRGSGGGGSGGGGGGKGGFLGDRSSSGDGGGGADSSSSSSSASSSSSSTSESLPPYPSGLIDEKGFVEVVQEIQSLLGRPMLDEARMQRLTVLVDRYSNNQILFSDCVRALAEEIGTLAEKAHVGAAADGGGGNS